jgi:hypothetical protein
VQLSVTAQSGVNYQWKNGTNNVGGNSNTLSVNSAGNFTVVLTNTCGTVTSSNSITVTEVGSAPVAPTITPNGNVNFCQGGGVALEVPAQAGVDYQWKQGTNNVGTNSPSLTVTTAGTFTVVVSNGCGSVNSTNSITTTVNQLPATPSISANGPTTFCSGSVTLSAPSGFASYEWSTGDTTQSITVSSSGTFNVQVTNLNGCQSGASNNVTVSVANNPVFSNISATICSNQPYNFNGQQLNVQGVYKDTLTTVNGCDSIVTLSLTVNQITIPVATEMFGVVSTDPFYVSYQWQLNGVDIPGAISPIYPTFQNGNYTVVVTDINGCTAVSNTLVVLLSSISEIASLNCMIYPNPVTTELMVEATEQIDEINVVDLNGRIIFIKTKISHQKLKVDVSALAEATYFIQIKTTSGKTALKTFVKQ